MSATPATVDSGSYQRALRRSAPGCEVTAVGSRDLAPLIQREGEWWDEELVDCVDRVCAPLVGAKVDTVILGCTHYPLIRPILQRVFGRDVTLVFSAEETAREVAETLSRKGIENEGSREGTYRFLTTGGPAAFRALGERFLQLPLGEVEQVTIAELEAAPA